jgi:outer membrane protein assembly factor BamD (BamD/ComL family)
MKFLLSILFFVCLSFVEAQPMSDLHKTAKNLMIEGDYENATLVFNKLLNNEPNNIAAQKDLAYLHYLKKDYSKSIEISKRFIDELSVEEKDYQILGLNYKAQGNYKECEKMYRI